MGVRDILRRLGLLQRTPAPGRGPIGPGARGPIRSPGGNRGGPTQGLDMRHPEPDPGRYVPRQPLSALPTEVYRPPAADPPQPPPPPAPAPVLSRPAAPAS